MKVLRILLERDLRDLVDIEFTVEAGKFWMLQYRKGKHSPRAALRMAIDMADDPDFPLTREEAFKRVEKILQNPPMLPVERLNPTKADLLTTGLPASPGRAIEALCTSVDEAVAAEGRGELVILVRRDTSPSDIAGMAASVGILTARGGQERATPQLSPVDGACLLVVGAEEIEVLDDGIKIGDRHILTTQAPRLPSMGAAERCCWVLTSTRRWRCRKLPLYGRGAGTCRTIPRPRERMDLQKMPRRNPYQGHWLSKAWAIWPPSRL